MEKKKELNLNNDVEKVETKKTTTKKVTVKKVKAEPKSEPKVEKKVSKTATKKTAGVDKKAVSKETKSAKTVSVKEAAKVVKEKKLDAKTEVKVENKVVENSEIPSSTKSTKKSVVKKSSVEQKEDKKDKPLKNVETKKTATKKSSTSAKPAKEKTKKEPVKKAEKKVSVKEAVVKEKPVEKIISNDKKKKLNVLYVVGECRPFVATGGLGEVAGSLPKAVDSISDDVDVRVILPLYGKIKNEYKDQLEYITSFTTHLSWRQEYCGLFKLVKDNVVYYFVDNERYFNRDGVYGYFDDGERFAYFCKSIVEGLTMLDDFFPDIIHCNDWQTALVSVYTKTGNWADKRYYDIKHIYTIHNVEYQGIYGMENLEDLFGIDYRYKNSVEYDGKINLTKAAIQYCDKISTVSDTYCDNLKESYCSQGLNYIIRRNEYKLCGIVNGIDYETYNPAKDELIYKQYDINSIENKSENKLAWQKELGLPVDKNIPMMSIVSRLVSHKGIGLLMQNLEEILCRDVQLVVVGTGDEKYVNYFKYLQSKYPTKVRAMVDGYSYILGRKAYAASDIFLMPSKIEPCGISQMIASRYGSVPVVREAGGLKDTIKDFGCEEGGNGYTFASYNANDLKNQINRAINDFADKEGWAQKMKTVMSVDFTWEKSAKKYIDLYKSIVK